MRLFKCLCHCQDGNVANEEIALASVMCSNHTPSPGRTCFPGVVSRFTTHSDNTDLPVRTSFIFPGHLCYSLCRRESAGKQLKPACSIGGIDPGLCGDGTNASFLSNV